MVITQRLSIASYGDPKQNDDLALALVDNKAQVAQAARHVPGESVHSEDTVDRGLVLPLRPHLSCR